MTNDANHNDTRKSMVDAARELGATDVRPVSQALEEAGYKSAIVTAKDVVNQIITILSIEHREGDYGEYIIINAVDPLGTELLKISTGGSVLVEKLSAIEAKGLFPVVASIVKTGRYYDLV